MSAKQSNRRRPRGCQRIVLAFTCIGRRVSLLNAFRDAADRLGVGLRVVGTDVTADSAALQCCDHKALVHRVDDPRYLPDLLGLVRKHRIELLIPTVDLDLKLLARHRPAFEELGCRVLISAPKVIDLCQDKRRTCRFLESHGFATPRTQTLREALARRQRYPLFLKPWDGAAARGNVIVRNRRELEVCGRRLKRCLVQEFVDGPEFTCDVYVDSAMQVRCVVPRRRLEVRGGEVSKSRVVKDRAMMELTGRLVEALGAGPGVITVQLIQDRRGRDVFIEINPRFGGGVPLSIRAGADFPAWILAEHLGRRPRIRHDGFRDGLTMLRYDAEVWVQH